LERGFAGKRAILIYGFEDPQRLPRSAKPSSEGMFTVCAFAAKPMTVAERGR